MVHPPVGKYVIGLGEWLFGFNPFGWRFMTALLGTLSVLMLCRIGRRLFRSTFLGCLAGALMAVDGLHFVMSRTALLDLVLMFFVLAAFGCLLVDRDRARARLAAALPPDADGRYRPDAHGRPRRTGLGLRPWRWRAGLLLGLAIGTKWNGLYFLVAFCLMTVLWDVGSRRVAGARTRTGRCSGATRASAVPGHGPGRAGHVPGVLDAAGSSRRRRQGRLLPATGRPPTAGAALDVAAGLAAQPVALRARGLRVPHRTCTSPHTLPVEPVELARPGPPGVVLLRVARSPARTAARPTRRQCAREVLALGTPLLWWAACFALLYVLYRWLLRRDWRAGAIACGIAAGYLPWFLYQDRTIFFFYAVVFVPFLCLAVAMMLGALLGPPGSDRDAAACGARWARASWSC